MIVSRRNFISGLLAAGAGFTILPGAGRIWKVPKLDIEELFDLLYELKKARNLRFVIPVPMRVHWDVGGCGARTRHEICSSQILH